MARRADREQRRKAKRRAVKLQRLAQGARASAEWHFGLALEAIEAQDREAAKTLLHKAIRANPRLWEAHEHLATLFQAEGDDAGSLAVLRDLVARHGPTPGRLGQVGTCLLGQGKAAEALVAFEEARRLLGRTRGREARALRRLLDEDIARCRARIGQPATRDEPGQAAGRRPQEPGPQHSLFSWIKVRPAPTVAEAGPSGRAEAQVSVRAEAPPTLPRAPATPPEAIPAPGAGAPRPPVEPESSVAEARLGGEAEWPAGPDPFLSSEPAAIAVSYATSTEAVASALAAGEYGSLSRLLLRLAAQRVGLAEEFDELLCLETLRGVERYWYQIETVKKVLRQYRGRALLCDEVGLGKTIEAAMVAKEYHLRGLVHRILILTPPSLVGQWQEELRAKFDLEFVTSQAAGTPGQDFWRAHPRIVASLPLARSRKHFEAVQAAEFDLVIVDEAHHLKNRSTLNWKLVNGLKKKFLLLLTATPVENDLMELYNLITLLRPGTLKTPAYFKREFVARGDPRTPAHRERLREILREVMVRNTRAVADVRLPPRRAATFLVPMGQAHRALYEQITAAVRDAYDRSQGLDRFTLGLLLQEAGSSPRAVSATLRRLVADGRWPRPAGAELWEALEAAGQGQEDGKAEKLRALIGLNPVKKIVFTRFTATLDYLSSWLAARGIPHVTFHGGLTPRQKDEAVAAFAADVDLLLSTEVGGEGRNLQFCATLINYDLPWNPMSIEQRIGRLHRIGQTREVFVFNLAAAGTVEEQILGVLHEKINMFELVIGEMEMILGHLDDERDFSEVVLDLWARASGPREAEAEFARLGQRLVEAKQQYLQTKELDARLFGRDLEV